MDRERVIEVREGWFAIELLVEKGIISAEGIKPLIPATKHATLRTLVFQSGGLPGSTVRALAECEFPELTHLEI